MNETHLINELKHIPGVKIPENIMDLLNEYRSNKNNLPASLIVSIPQIAILTHPAPVQEKLLPKPSCPLPYFPNMTYTGCKAIRLNHKLYTPCGQIVISNGFCKVCIKSGPKYGTLEDRKKCLPCEYKTPNGESPLNYGNVMEKLFITREEAIREASKWKQTIPEEQFEIIKKKRGRKKKIDTIITSDEELIPEVKKERRGRPTKENHLITEREVNDEDIKGELFRSGNGELVIKGFDGKFYDIKTGKEL